MCLRTRHHGDTVGTMICTQQHLCGRKSGHGTCNANDITAPDCGNEFIKGEWPTREHVSLRHDLQLHAVRVQVHEAKLA